MKTQKYSELKGNGKVKFSDFELESQFVIEMYLGEESKLLLFQEYLSQKRIEFLNKLPLDVETIAATFDGMLDDGRYVTAEKVILISTGALEGGKSLPIKFKVFSDVIIRGSKPVTPVSTSRISYLITNFEFEGCDITVKPKKSSYDKCIVQLENVEITITQIDNYREVIKKLKNRELPYAITAELIINIDLSDVDKINTIVNNLCKLLSIVSGNSVTPVETQHFMNSILVLRQKYLLVNIEEFKNGNSLIPKHNPNLLRYFIEKSYPSYVTYKDELNLPIVIEYFIFLKTYKVMDIKCLLAYILLECLSDSAKNFLAKVGQPVPNDSQERNKKLIYKILPQDHNLSKEIIEEVIIKLSSQHPSLPTTIHKLMKYFKMDYKPNEPDLFGLRKDFVHKGMYPKDSNYLEIYHRLVHFIDRLFLHILDYEGPFLNITNGYQEEKIKKVQ